MGVHLCLKAATLSGKRFPGLAHICWRTWLLRNETDKHESKVSPLGSKKMKACGVQAAAWIAQLLPQQIIGQTCGSRPDPHPFATLLSISSFTFLALIYVSLVANISHSSAMCLCVSFHIFGEGMFILTKLLFSPVWLVMTGAGRLVTSLIGCYNGALSWQKGNEEGCLVSEWVLCPLVSAFCEQGIFFPQQTLQYCMCLHEQVSMQSTTYAYLPIAQWF